MPNPSNATVPGKVTYDVLLISTTTGRVRAILASKLESSHSLATVKAWDAQVGTKEALVTDSTHGKHQVGDIFKDYVKEFGYFDKGKAAAQRLLNSGNAGLPSSDCKGP